MRFFRHRWARLRRSSGHPYLRTQASLHNFDRSECRAASGSWTVSSSEGFWRFFPFRRNHRLSRRMVVPLPQRSVVQWSTTVVVLWKQGVTHHLLSAGWGRSGPRETRCMHSHLPMALQWCSRRLNHRLRENDSRWVVMPNWLRFLSGHNPSSALAW